ncbi:uncharacterized protein FTOL_12181 [Fusarium torulosum]|uniref:Uncharacterized protein n=1 Tax=Fusarium torulosum TaxID=33205 RepID=A0AAE8SNM5_9HYPO|nr:uncharacterized protein FTOL_12181 [Fusarium torulosum]
MNPAPASIDQLWHSGAKYRYFRSPYMGTYPKMNGTLDLFPPLASTITRATATTITNDNTHRSGLEFIITSPID